MNQTRKRLLSRSLIGLLAVGVLMAAGVSAFTNKNEIMLMFFLLVAMVIAIGVFQSMGWLGEPIVRFGRKAK